MISLASAAGDDHRDSRNAPLFDGTRSGFITWFIMVSGWVAWKLTKCTKILEETEPRPVRPSAHTDTPPRRIPLVTIGGVEQNRAEYDQRLTEIAAHGRPTPIGATRSTDGTTGVVTITNAAAVADRDDLIAAWDKEHVRILELEDDWDERNVQLYGALLSALPDWLKTSVYTDCRNDGLATIQFVRNSFDANDANDHASHLAKLGAHYIDSRNEISEGDLRLQHDAMMVAKAGIIRTGNVPPLDSAICAMYDNSLPIAYSQIRQLVRRANHTTFVAHYNDYMGQTRAELSARAPVVRAFAANDQNGGQNQHFLPLPPGGRGGRGRNGRGRGRDGQGGGGGHPANPCLQCGSKEHSGRDCPKNVANCTHCHKNHLSVFCPRGPAHPRREALSDGAKRYLQNQINDGNAGAHVAQANPAAAQVVNPHTAMVAAQPNTNTGMVPVQQQPAADPVADANAHQAAAVAAAAHRDPAAAANAYVSAMRAMGFMMRPPACAHCHTRVHRLPG